MRALPRLLVAALLIAGSVACDEPHGVDGELDAAIADAARDAILKRHLREMRESGFTHFPADALPATVRDELGLREGERVAVERFYAPAFQDAMAKHGSGQGITLDVDELPAEILADPDVLAAIHAAFGPGVDIITTPEILRALNDQPSDHELHAAVELSIDDLSPAAREEISRRLQARGETPQHPPGSLPFERLPTDEVLAKLDEGSRTALAPYRDLLDDHWALMDAMPAMTQHERDAASKFISRMPKPRPPAADSDYAKTVRRWRERGYRDAPGAPRGTVLLATIEQANLRARERAADGNAPIAPAPFGELKEWSGDSPAPIPDELIAPGSKTHVLAEGAGSAAATGAVRLYTRSVFDDALLLVEEFEADAFYPRDPNLTIAGHPATVGWALFENGAWTTTVAGYDGRRVHHITVEKKLDSAERDRFIRLASDIIEEAAFRR